MSPERERFNPFPGLRAFEPEEDHLFFGREGQVDELLARLRRTRFLGVVGASGSGKSSLVRCGLIPSLYSGFMAKAGSSWRVAVFRPGKDPIGNLAAALADPAVLGSGEPQGEDDPELADAGRMILETTLRRSARGLAESVRQARVPAGENVLVVVDQFEELFRFKNEVRRSDAQGEAAAFVHLLLTAAEQQEVPVYVTLTMRSDFIGNCTEISGLAEAINEGQYLIPRMTREERRSAIEGPVAVGGAEIAPRLVLRLLNDVGDNPDQLPILQHALMRTWEYWAGHHEDGEPLDLRHYEAVGTLREALSQHAEEAHAELDRRGQEIAEILFKALTDRGSDSRGIRRPSRLAEICELARARPEEVCAVVECFRRPGRTFLMPPAGVPLEPDTILDISHESLMRIWNRLIEWVEEEARSARLYLHLSRTAGYHQEGKAALLRDPELQLAINWRDETQPTAAWAERYDPAFERAVLFLSHSEAERGREVAHKEAQRRRQLQWTRRLAIVLGSAFVATGMVGIYAFDQRSEAVNQQERAEDQTRKAHEQRQQAEQERKRAEEQEALAQEETRRAEEARLKSIEQERRATAEMKRAEQERQRAEAAQAEAEAQRLEAEAQRLEAEVQRQQAETKRLEAVAAEKEARRLRQLATAEVLAVQALGLQQADQRELAALLARQAYLLRHAAHLDEDHEGVLESSDVFTALRVTLSRLDPNGARVIRDAGEAVRALALAPDGRSLLYGGDDGALRLAPMAGSNGGALVAELGSEVRSLAASEAARLVAVGTLDGSLRLLEPSGRRRSELAAPGAFGAAVFALAFRADGEALASGDASGAVRLWSVESGSGELLYPARGDRVTGLAFGAQGERLAAATAGGLLLWDEARAGSAAAPLGPPRALASVAFGPHGSWLAIGQEGGTVELWRADGSGDPLTLNGHVSKVNALSFSPDGRWLASASSDRTVRLWDLEHPEAPPVRFEDSGGWVWGVTFDRSGSYLAAAGSDRAVRVWNVRSHDLAEAICGRVSRNLTAVEWEEYLEGETYQSTCGNLPAGATGQRARGGA